MLVGIFKIFYHKQITFVERKQNFEQQIWSYDTPPGPYFRGFKNRNDRFVGKPLAGNFAGEGSPCSPKRREDCQENNSMNLPFVLGATVRERSAHACTPSISKKPGYLRFKVINGQSFLLWEVWETPIPWSATHLLFPPADVLNPRALEKPRNPTHMFRLTSRTFTQGFNYCRGCVCLHILYWHILST